jgi:glutathione peroxidase
MTTSIYEVPVNRADGSATTLAEHKGKALLIVNVASACGLTPQYAALESTFEKYRDRGLMVIGFPCNDFGAQEPGTAEEIQTFCTSKFNVQFPVMQKLSVKSDHRHPLYKNLIDAQPKATFRPESDFKAKMASYGIKQENESDIFWNFEKFLVDRSGKVVARFSPDTPPDDPSIVAAIEKVLAS